MGQEQSPTGLPPAPVLQEKLRVRHCTADPGRGTDSGHQLTLQYSGTRSAPQQEEALQYFGDEGEIGRNRRDMWAYRAHRRE